MDSEESSPEELISELNHGSGDGTGRRGGFGARQRWFYTKALPKHWATKLATLVGVLSPLDVGLPVSIESWWTPWYQDSLPRLQQGFRRPVPWPPSCGHIGQNL